MKTLLLLLFLAACSTTNQQAPTPTPTPVPAPLPAPTPDVVEEVDLAGATPVKLWATVYYMKKVNSSANGIPLRDMNDKVIGPKLDERTWCLSAIEGTVFVDGQVYNYAGTKWPKQANCSHSASSRVRWKVSPFKYGIGNRNNPLIPFKTIACDQGNVKNSKPWLNGGYAKFGQKIYIPAAKGVELPDGTIHDGIFICGDTGGMINGNDIDVFLGEVIGGDAGAKKVTPFNFISTTTGKTVDAYVLR